MKLSLSVRIAEAACKTKLNIPFPQVAEIAAATGYSALCMRASVAGVHSSQAELEEIRGIVEQAGLVVSMVTADLDIPQNNDQAPQALRHIEPSLHVAEALGSHWYGSASKILTIFLMLNRLVIWRRSEASNSCTSFIPPACLKSWINRLKY